MALGIVPNGIKTEMNYTQNGVPVVNRFYTVVAGSPTQSDLEDAVAAAHAFYLDIQPLQHPSLILQNITSTDVSVANGIQEIESYSTSNAGTSAGTAAASNAAQVVSLRTANTGRSFRGRFYVGGLSNNNLADAQNWGTGQTSTLVGAFEDFIDSLTAIGHTLVVVSNYANKVVRLVALATEIISVIVDTKVDSQRRRTAN